MTYPATLFSAVFKTNIELNKRLNFDISVYHVHKNNFKTCQIMFQALIWYTLTPDTKYQLRANGVQTHGVKSHQYPKSRADKCHGASFEYQEVKDDGFFDLRGVISSKIAIIFSI